MKLRGENQSTRRKTCPMPLDPPQIQHGPTRSRPGPRRREASDKPPEECHGPPLSITVSAGASSCDSK
jgi:hypothetical protein